MSAPALPDPQSQIKPQKSVKKQQYCVLDYASIRNLAQHS